MNLYSEHAKEFSETRQFPWLGWKCILPHIQNLENISVLDLGCGNGRFYNFLKDNLKNDFSYTGVDNESEILAIAQTNLPSNANLIQVDLQNSDWVNKLPKDRKFTVVVAFGLFHHIKSYKRREELLTESYNLLTGKGIQVIAYWQFEDNIEFLNKHKTKPSDAILDSYKFEVGDYYLTFGQKNIKRFCHSFSDEEIKKMYKNTEIEILEEYQSDGLGNKMNKYVIN